MKPLLVVTFFLGVSLATIPVVKASLVLGDPRITSGNILWYLAALPFVASCLTTELNAIVRRILSIMACGALLYALSLLLPSWLLLEDDIPDVCGFSG